MAIGLISHINLGVGIFSTVLNIYCLMWSVLLDFLPTSSLLRLCSWFIGDIWCWCCGCFDTLSVSSSEFVDCCIIDASLYRYILDRQTINNQRDFNKIIIHFASNRGVSNVIYINQLNYNKIIFVNLKQILKKKILKNVPIIISIIKLIDNEWLWGNWKTLKRKCNSKTRKKQQQPKENK